MAEKGIVRRAGIALMAPSGSRRPAPHRGRARQSHTSVVHAGKTCYTPPPEKRNIGYDCG